MNTNAQNVPNANTYRKLISHLATGIESEKTLRRIYYFVERLWREEPSPALDSPQDDKAV